ncbi:MAG TPA: hypothetical protein VHD36_17190 [Pirellulales bacterium]|nr:hypothetical protein [Pirellulales bacterium]
MKFVKRLSILSGAALLTLGALSVPAGAQNTTSSSVQNQQPRTTARTTAQQRRNYRAYSYEPSRGGDISVRASSPTWQRADSKVKFRYGPAPY